MGHGLVVTENEFYPQSGGGGLLSSTRIPWRKVGTNFGLFAATVLLTGLQGGKYFPSPLGIPPTSIFSLLVSMLPFFFLSVVSHYQMKGVVETYQRQQDPRFILAPNEVQVECGCLLATMSSG